MGEDLEIFGWIKEYEKLYLNLNIGLTHKDNNRKIIIFKMKWGMI